MATEANCEVPAVTVRNLPGKVLAIVAPVPPDVAALKAAIHEVTGCPTALQQLVDAAAMRPLDDTETLEAVAIDITMVIDETPMFTWDHAGNPRHDVLEVGGSTVKCPELNTDYINVITKEPMRSGVHYFQFLMHMIGDEQWCGVMDDPMQAGSRFSGRRLMAWTYYCGRMRSSSKNICDGAGALHALGRAVKEFKKLRPTNDVIGMLVDLEKGAIAFELNGELQGACAIPVQKPLWVCTHVDTPTDHVELVKLSLQDAPQESIEALSGAMLDLSSGLQLNAFNR